VQLRFTLYALHPAFMKSTPGWNTQCVPSRWHIPDQTTRIHNKYSQWKIIFCVSVL
jgi:hypothetical protein